MFAKKTSGHVLQVICLFHRFCTILAFFKSFVSCKFPLSSQLSRDWQYSTHIVKFTRLLQYITPHRATLLLVLLLLLADSIAALTQPWIAGKLASAALDGGGGNDYVTIQKVLLLWLGLITVKSILSFCSSYLVGSTGERMAAKLRKRVY